MQKNLSFQELTIHSLPGKSTHGMGCLYIAEFGGIVKVGCTANPLKRLLHLQSSTGMIFNRLLISNQHYLYRDTERQVHNLISMNRISGEWFSMHSDDILKYSSSVSCSLDMPIEIKPNWLVSTSKAKTFTPICVFESEVDGLHWHEYKNTGVIFSNYGSGMFYIMIKRNSAQLIEKSKKKQEACHFFLQCWMLKNMQPKHLKKLDFPKSATFIRKPNPYIWRSQNENNT